MAKKENKFGWLRDLPDYNDKYYTAPLMADLPSQVDLRPQLPPVFTQGSVGSCTAQALAALIQYDATKQNKIDKSTPSRLFIYYNERELQGTTDFDSGASMRVGIQALARYGFCEEMLWPYNTNKWKSKPPRQAYRQAVQCRISQYARLNQNLDQFKTALATGNPFVFGFTVYEDFESQSVKDHGVLPMPSGKLIGGHAVLAVGYDESDSTMLVRNSWGPEWALGGYFKMPFAYIVNPNLAADFWTISFVP